MVSLCIRPGNKCNCFKLLVVLPKKGGGRNFKNQIASEISIFFIMYTFQSVVFYGVSSVNNITLSAAIPIPPFDGLQLWCHSKFSNAYCWVERIAGQYCPLPHCSMHLWPQSTCCTLWWWGVLEVNERSANPLIGLLVSYESNWTHTCYVATGGYVAAVGKSEQRKEVG